MHFSFSLLFNGNMMKIYKKQRGEVLTASEENYRSFLVFLRVRNDPLTLVTTLRFFPQIKEELL